MPVGGAASTRTFEYTRPLRHETPHDRYVRLRDAGYFSASCQDCGRKIGRKFGKANADKGKGQRCRKCEAVRRHRLPDGTFRPHALRTGTAHDIFAAGAMPNPYCPNEYPGAERCGSFAPHTHCECGLAIGENESTVACLHDPILTAANLWSLLERFPAIPLTL